MESNHSTLTKDLVTIAIPIYNAEEYVKFAIQSVINQSFKNWELLLMEDGSTDSSCAIAEEYAKKDARIRVINDGENKGLIYRLNQSIAMANGEFYARMDADDIMYLTRIEEEFNFLKENANVDVVGASIMTIDNHNNIIGSGYNKGKVCGFIHPTVMGRTEWFQANPYADWALRGEDFELWTRTSAKSNFYAIGKPLLFYREFGLPSFKKNYLTERAELMVYRRYKQYGKSFGWFVKNSFITWIKISIYATFNLFGKMDVIVKRRRRTPIPQADCLTVSDLQESIKIK